MRIVYHLGAHSTDEERLIRCLLKNRATLAAEGTSVPSPTRYRRLLRDTAVQLRGAEASDETREMILDQILGEDLPERMVLSWDSFLAFPQWALRRRLYDFAGERLRAFTRIFPGCEAEFHLALRNPATLLPALFEKQKDPRDYATFIGGVDPLSLRWSDVVTQILALNPGVPLTLWCDEDMPLIEEEVLRLLAGTGPGTPLAESDELLRNLLSKEGYEGLRASLENAPASSVEQRRARVAAVLASAARPEAVEPGYSLPGWDQALADAITHSYYEDLDYIATLSGVRLIRP